MFGKLLPIAGVVGVLSVALAGSAMAGGFPGPGHFSVSDTSASAFSGDPKVGPFTSVFVDRGQLFFKSKTAPGAPLVQKNGTMLSVSGYSASGSVYGCWIIPDADFTMAHDLSSARLNVPVSDEAVPCPGYFVASAIAGKPGLANSIGYGGVGGGGTGGTLPVSLTWTASGAAWNNSESFDSSCQGFVSTSRSTFDYALSTAGGSVNGQAFQDPTAEVATSTGQLNQNSTPSAACAP
jgi:hypothetical protein